MAPEDGEVASTKVSTKRYVREAGLGSRVPLVGNSTIPFCDYKARWYFAAVNPAIIGNGMHIISRPKKNVISSGP
jgi:hypothetical protein